MSILGCGGSLLIKGATKLSELEIDVDRDWGLKGISNIREIVTGMSAGDIVYHDGAKLVKLSPGPVSSELITLGPGQNPKWGWIA